MRLVVATFALLAGCSLLTDLDSLGGSSDATTDVLGDASVVESGVDCNMPGLVAYWSIDEGSGFTVNDCKGATNGELVGAVSWAHDSPTLGDAGNAIYFDGGGGSVQFPTNGAALEIVAPFSISLWMKPDAPALPEVQDLAARFDGTTGTWGLGVDTDAGKCYFTVFTPALFEITSSAPYVPLAWQHVVAVFDVGDGAPLIELFINAIEQGSGVPTANIASTSIPMQLGVNGAGNTRYHGLMTKVAFFSRALTQPDITALYQSQH